MRALKWSAVVAAVFAMSCANAGESDRDDDTGARDAAVVGAPDATPVGPTADARPVPGAPDAAGTICGDNVCNGDETCDWCAFDCGACPGVCGDDVCSVDEDCASCAADCGDCPVSSCGDAVCDMAGGECTSCPSDCTGMCGGGGGGPCAHDKCEIGGPLDPSCDPCVDTICSLDFYCCLVEWDVSCKNAVSSCGESC